MPRKPTILLVDDEPLIARMLFAVLDQQGYAVTACTSGWEAADRIYASESGFDLVVTDLNLGDDGVSGAELAFLVRKKSPAAGVLLITGDRAAAFAAGAPRDTVILEKPFLPSELLDALERLKPVPASLFHE